MAKPDSDMEGTICKNCQRPINEHLPEELEECLRILNLISSDSFLPVSW